MGFHQSSSNNEDSFTQKLNQLYPPQQLASFFNSLNLHIAKTVKQGIKQSASKIVEIAQKAKEHKKEAFWAILAGSVAAGLAPLVPWACLGNVPISVITTALSTPLGQWTTDLGKNIIASIVFEVTKEAWIPNEEFKITKDLLENIVQRLEASAEISRTDISQGLIDLTCSTQSLNILLEELNNQKENLYFLVNELRIFREEVCDIRRNKELAWIPDNQRKALYDILGASLSSVPGYKLPVQQFVPVSALDLPERFNNIIPSQIQEVLRLLHELQREHSIQSQAILDKLSSIPRCRYTEQSEKPQSSRNYSPLLPYNGIPQMRDFTHSDIDSVSKEVTTKKDAKPSIQPVHPVHREADATFLFATHPSNFGFTDQEAGKTIAQRIITGNLINPEIDSVDKEAASTKGIKPFIQAVHPLNRKADATFLFATHPSNFGFTDQEAGKTNNLSALVDEHVLRRDTQTADIPEPVRLSFQSETIHEEVSSDIASKGTTVYGLQGDMYFAPMGPTPHAMKHREIITSLPNAEDNTFKAIKSINQLPYLPSEEIPAYFDSARLACLDKQKFFLEQFPAYSEDKIQEINGLSFPNLSSTLDIRPNSSPYPKSLSLENDCCEIATSTNNHAEDENFYVQQENFIVEENQYRRKDLVLFPSTQPNLSLITEESSKSKPQIDIVEQAFLPAKLANEKAFYYPRTNGTKALPPASNT